MEINILKTFQRVANLGSISKTADDLYLSISTVTGRIKALEEELGKELFIRAGRRIELTHDGEQFLQYVNRFIAILQDGQTKVKLTKNAHVGELRLAVTPIVASYLLPKLIREYHAKYPQIHLRLTAGPNYQVIEKVNSGQVELGVVHHMLEEGGLLSQSWFHSEIILVMPKEHPLANRSSIEPSDLEGYSILGYPNHPKWDSIIKWFKDAKVTPNIMMEVGHVETLKQLLLEFNAISFLPRIALEEGIQDNIFTTVKTLPSLGVSWNFEFISRQNLPVSLPALSFIEFASKYVK
jgi:DNA-binding transcriptional LysR family regulator